MILNGWKEIAAYVNSSVRTVQRWEKAGMPVVRPVPGARGSVIAHSEQLDSWLRRSLEIRPLAPSFHAKLRHEDLHQNVAWARSLAQRLEMLKLEIGGHMILLQVQVALLQQHVNRMKFAGGVPAELPPPLSSAEVRVAALVQPRRRSA